MPNGFFGQNLQKVRNRKKDHDHRILHIRNSLVNKFQLKLTISNFWTKLTQKGISNLRKNKIKITIELYLSELV